jgi:hypothetical protein
LTFIKLSRALYLLDPLDSFLGLPQSSPNLFATHFNPSQPSSTLCDFPIRLIRAVIAMRLGRSFKKLP